MFTPIVALADVDDEVRGEDGEVAVREIDETHHAERERQAGREQRVQPAEQDPLHDALTQVISSTPKYAAVIARRGRASPDAAR